MGDADLMWDHSAGEHLIGTDPDEYQRLDESSILEAQSLHDDDGDGERESLLGSSCEHHVRLSSNQLRYVLRSLDEAAALLRERQRSLVQRSLARRRQADVSAADASTNSCLADASQRAHTDGDRATGDVRFRCQEPPSTFLGQLAHRCCCRFNRPTGIQQHAAAISFALQAVMLVSICIMEAVSPAHLQPSRAEMVVAIAIASISLLISLSASGLTVSQLIWQSGCPVRPVVSSYVSCVVSFAGFYAALYQIKDDSWRVEAPSQPPYLFADVYCRMLYLSVTTSCLSDTAAVVPMLWYSYFLQCMQMLLTVIYWGTAGYHAALANRRSHFRNGSRTADAGFPRIRSGHRSLAASETSLISREHNFIGYGTVQSS